MQDNYRAKANEIANVNLVGGGFTCTAALGFVC